MKVSFNLSATDFSADEREIVKANLSIDNTDVFGDCLQKIAKCAFLEYKKMFIERGLPTKAEEVRQERLFYLIMHYFIDRLPTESEISTIFQLTASQSKTLLKNTRSVFRTRLQKQIKNSIRAVLKDARQDKDDMRMVIQSDNILEEMNLIINQKGPTLKKLLAVRGSAGEYYCPKDTYDLLMEVIGADG